MKKKVKKTVTSPFFIGILILSMSIAVIAAVLHFKTHEENSHLTKSDIFDFILETNMEETTVLPEESFKAAPIVTSKATVSQYYCIEITTPSVNGESLYTLEPGDGWIFMESASEENKLIYAYASDGAMTEIACDESTEPLTDQITMKNISVGEYAAIDDININVKGYAIGVDTVGNDPVEVWEECKELDGR